MTRRRGRQGGQGTAAERQSTEVNCPQRFCDCFPDPRSHD